MKQLTLLPEPAFFPMMPPRHSDAELALNDLLEGDLTHPDWLRMHDKWRLASAVHKLKCLGWELTSILVQVNDRSRPIARYSLSKKAKQAVYAMRHQGECHV